ncbi:MAG: M28 family peptidase [Polyangiaceae bacterium]
MMTDRQANRRALRAALLLLGVSVAALFALWALCIRMPGESHQGALPPSDAALRESAARLERVVTELSTTIGERNLERPESLERAAVYLEAELIQLGYRVESQRFQAGGVPCRNLLTTLPAAAGSDIFVFGAHYDSALGSPAANDNGSGVAALLELARAVRGRRLHETLRFELYTNEEPPHFQTPDMGSVHAAAAGARVAAMFSLETLGYYDDHEGAQRYPSPLAWFYPARGDFVAFVGNYASRELLRAAIGSFRRHEAFPSEGGALPGFLPGVGWSDHWAYWQQGVPAIMLTDTALFRDPAYHTPGDLPRRLSFERLARVVRGLSALVSEL